MPGPNTGKAEDSPSNPVTIVALRVMEALDSPGTFAVISRSPDGVILRVFYRGEHRASHEIRSKAYRGVLARFKKLAGLDVAERRMPQAGGFRMTGSCGPATRFRVTTHPQGGWEDLAVERLC